MGTIRNPGKFDCLAKAFPHEPMFTLLGRDPDAPMLIRLWANLRRRMGEDPAKCTEAENLAHAMEIYWSVMDGDATDADVLKCRLLAQFYHNGQVDKQGAPYFDHIEHVASQVHGRTTKCIAYLHDCVEDGRATYSALKNEGVPDSVIEGVRALEHDKRVPYEVYIAGILRTGDPRLFAVKVADLRHNMRPGLGGSIGLYNRYERALAAFMATEVA